MFQSGEEAQISEGAEGQVEPDLREKMTNKEERKGG